MNTVDTGRKLNVHKTSWTSSERIMYVQFTSCVYWETMDESLQMLWKSNNQKHEDSFDVFGEHIANEIRPLDNGNAERCLSEV